MKGRIGGDAKRQRGISFDAVGGEFRKSGHSDNTPGNATGKRASATGPQRKPHAQRVANANRGEHSPIPPGSPAWVDKRKMMLGAPPARSTVRRNVVPCAPFRVPSCCRAGRWLALDFAMPTYRAAGGSNP